MGRLAGDCRWLKVSGPDDPPRSVWRAQVTESDSRGQSVENTERQAGAISTVISGEMNVGGYKLGGRFHVDGTRKIKDERGTRVDPLTCCAGHIPPCPVPPNRPPLDSVR